MGPIVYGCLGEKPSYVVIIWYSDVVMKFVPWWYISGRITRQIIATDLPPKGSV